MSILTGALNRLLNWLQNNIPKYAHSLKPGLQRDQIVALTSDLPFQLPEEIYELYQWHNGATESLKSVIAYPPQFLPLKEALAITHQYLLPNGISYRGEMIFPFLGMENNYCGVLASKKVSSNQPVVYLHPEDEPRLAFASITSMMLSLAQCFETGAFFLEDKFICEHKVEVATIYRLYNPGLMNELVQILRQLLIQPTDFLENEYSDLIELLTVFKEYQDPEITESLMEVLEVLRSSSSEQMRLLRIWVVETLGETIDARITSFLIHLLQNEVDWAVRCSIATALGKLGDQSAIVPLSQMVMSPRDQGQTSNQALSSLYKLGASDTLAQFLNHPDDEIRASTARYLGYLAR